jgi:hypothetical protein
MNQALYAHMNNKRKMKKKNAGATGWAINSALTALLRYVHKNCISSRCTSRYCEMYCEMIATL